MINWDEIQVEWETTPISLEDIAEKYDVKLGTLKSRKSRGKWKKLDGMEMVTLQAVDQAVKDTIEEAEIVTRVNTLTARKPRTNSPWLKHLPYEVLEIMQDMEEVEPLDILYDQIRLQWSIIVRAQEIMFVEDKTDIDKFKTGQSMESDSYEIHTSWDKHGKFMAQLTTAQKELRGLIKEFMTIAPVEDERRLRMAQIQASTELTQLTAKKLKGEAKDTSMLDVLIGAMQGVQK